MNKYKIKQDLKIDGIIEIFENESLVVKSIKEIIKLMKKVILISIIYFLGMCYIQQYKILPFFYAVIGTFLLVIYVYRVFGNVTYRNSKKLGGKIVKWIEDKDKKFSKTSAYNIKLMKKDEIRMVKKILKVNKLDNIDSMREIKNYLLENKNKKEIDIGKFARDLINLYIIPITFGIIGIYTSFNLNTQIEQELINIGYSIFFSIISIAIIIIIYIIIKVRNFSIRNTYTHQRLVKILTELLLQKYTK